jgi:hypothetical protein
MELSKVNYFTYFPCLVSDDQVRLLPSDHALYYPLEFDPTSKTIKKGELNFFNKVLHNKYHKNNILSDIKWKKDGRNTVLQKAVIINLLDNCYGHSFLKLLNLFNIYEKYGRDHDLWVITPSPISHFIPADKFFVVEVSIGFNDAMNCYSLEPIIVSVKQQYAKYDFVTLDTYSLFKDRKAVVNFFPFLEHTSDKRKYLTFYYRSDYFRTWGGAGQSKNITAYFRELRTYFGNEIEFVVVGDKDGHKFPAEIIDKRTNAFGKAVDLVYNAIFSNSVMVIGLIGSNMLQPSMFCDFTVHLVPRSKVSIVAEEFFNLESPAIQNWFNNIYLFGNENLGDLSPSQVVEKTISLYLTYLAKCYKKEVFSDVYFKRQISQPDYLKEKFPFFQLEKANTLKQKITNESFSHNLWRYRLTKVLQKLKLSK